MKENPVQKNEIVIHNKILPTYKGVHVDGAYGGITTRGLINISFFSERSPIPTGSVFTITEQGKLGELIGDFEGSKKGIVREFEIGVYMDITIAKALAVLLNSKVEELESAKIK